MDAGSGELLMRCRIEVRRTCCVQRAPSLSTTTVHVCLGMREQHAHAFGEAKVTRKVQWRPSILVCHVRIRSVRQRGSEQVNRQSRVSPRNASRDRTLTRAHLVISTSLFAAALRRGSRLNMRMASRLAIALETRNNWDCHSGLQELSLPPDPFHLTFCEAYVEACCLALSRTSPLPGRLL